MVFDRLALSALGTALILLTACAAVHAQSHIVQTAASISIQPNTDAHQTLIDLGDGGGIHRIDVNNPAFSGVVVFQKKQDATYRNILIDGKTITLPQITTPHVTLPLTDSLAATQAGRAGAPDKLPGIILPDWSMVRDAEFPESTQTINTAGYRRLVHAAANPATIHLRTPIANQTAHPADASRKSVYLAASNPLFNQTTGQTESVLHYLIEIPLDPKWMNMPGDISVNVDPTTIRAHISNEEIATSNGMERITGTRCGGLTQLVKGAAVAVDGNIYFQRPYRGVIRFNIHKKRYEAPPVDLWSWYRDHLTPQDSEIHQAHPDLSVRPDFGVQLFTLDGRIYVYFGRYYHRKSGSEEEVLAAAILSAPLEHWDDKEAFEKDIRIIAEGHPTAPHHLYDVPAQVNDERLKLRVLTGVGKQLLLFSNSFDRLWWIQLDKAGGNTKRIVPVETTIAGKQVDRFQEIGKMHLDENGEVLGIHIDAILDGSNQWTQLWVDANTGKLSVSIPTSPVKIYDTIKDFTLGQHLEFTRNLSYGESRWKKNNFARELGMDPYEPGGITMHWDASTAIHDAAEAADPVLLKQMLGFSSGPGFMIATIPDDHDRIIGAADYPSYYTSYYDIPTTGDITRRMIRSESTLTPLGLGPYAHAWRGRALWIAGYTGVARFDSDDSFLSDAPMHRTWLARHLIDTTSGDDAKAGPIKWMTDLCFGLNGKVLTTGYDSIGRGGTPYSTGLRWKNKGDDAPWHALSELSRAWIGKNMATRYRINADGKEALDIVQFAHADSGMIAAIPEEQRPQSRAARVLFYEDRGDTVVDRFNVAVAVDQAHSLAPEAVAVSDNGLYLLLISKEGILSTVAFDTMQFVDAVRLPGNVAGSARRSTLLRDPNGGGVLVIKDREQNFYTLVHITINDNGSINTKPLMKLTPDVSDLFDGAVSLLLRKDGTTDLLIGPPPMRGDATMVVIPGINSKQPQVMKKKIGEQTYTLTPVLVDDFSDLNNWVNITPNTTWETKDRSLRGHWGPNGSDLWSKETFSGNLYVSFTATLLTPDPSWVRSDTPQGGKNINLRFLVKGPQSSDILDSYRALGEAKQGPNGVGDDQYHGYFFTFTHTHARLRRSPGYDMVSEDKTAIPKIGHPYHIEAIKIGNRLQYFIDGKLIHDYTDPHPFNEGRLGLTLWRSAALFKDFHVYSIEVEGTK